MPDRDKAIADLKEMRRTHEEWLRHVTPGPTGAPRCPHCPENIAEIVGDAAHHRECIESYDNALAVLAEKGGDRG